MIALAGGFLITGFALPGSGEPSYKLLAALPLWIVVNKTLSLYDRDAHVIDKSTINELPRIVQSLAIGTGLLFMAAPALGIEVHRRQALLFMLVATLISAAARWLVRTAVRRLYGAERTLIVGSGAVAEILARKLRAHPEYGISLVGIVDVPESSAASPNGNGNDNGHGNGNGHDESLGALVRFQQLCRDGHIDRVVVGFSSLSHEHLLNIVRTCKLLGLKVTVVPRFFEVLGRSVEMDEVEGMNLLGLRPLPRTRSSLLLKRAIDVTVALAGLVLLAPLLLLIALAIKLTSRGGVLFAQERIGRANKPFRLLKFRTMVDGADALKRELAHMNEASYPMFKIADDPRITPVGRVLRTTSLDELPQLWNVLRGEMSLVGPRPLVPSEDGEVVGWHRARLELTPGLTGPWQVMGRHSIPFQEMVKLDYLYVADWSLWNDLKLLIRTAPVVLLRRGC